MVTMRPMKKVGRAMFLVKLCDKRLNSKHYKHYNVCAMHILVIRVFFK